MLLRLWNFTASCVQDIFANFAAQDVADAIKSNEQEVEQLVRMQNATVTATIAFVFAPALQR